MKISIAKVVKGLYIWEKFFVLLLTVMSIRLTACGTESEGYKGSVDIS